MTSTALGFVGLGNMGAVMSARLVAAGFTVHGFDLSPTARAALLPGTFNSGFALRMMVKDMRIALGLAELVGAPDRLSRSSLELWAAAADALPPTADQTELAAWVQRLSTPGDDRSGD